MAKTLLTGGTGLIGSHLARALLRRGDDLRVAVRSSSRLDNLEGLEYEPVRCDILDRRMLRRARLTAGETMLVVGVGGGVSMAGLVLGVAEATVVYFGLSSFRDAIAFGILIIILLFKPAGLFGSVKREKV